MPDIQIQTLAEIAGLGFLVATGALIAVMFAGERRHARPATAFEPDPSLAAVFLFDEGLLVDLTDQASRFLDRCPPGEDAWQRLLAQLSAGFPGLARTLDELGPGERLELQGDAAGEPLRLQAELSNGMLRLSLIDTANKDARIEVGAGRLKSMERDARLLDAISSHSPGPIWMSSADDGRLTWANAAYISLVRDLRGEASVASWPLPDLFRSQGVSTDRPRKVALDGLDGDKPRWFEVTSAGLGDGILHFAAPADAAVSAERAMQEVVQTLAKTFAHLPIGLAIFSRDRRLTLFNPALTDLSGLPATFLGERPTLTAVLDELRNRQIIAEPKNYKSWRQIITQLETEAERGTYAESWSLPDGRTLRVTGRPHPDGAIAFLFEDITDEIALTRRFRKDTQLGQAILDELPLALAVFARDGTMTLANAAFTELWGIDLGTTLGSVGIADAARRWIERSAPTPIWGDVRDFVTVMSERSEWTGEIGLRDGGQYELRCTPLPGGDSLVAFVELPPEPAMPVRSRELRSI